VCAALLVYFPFFASSAMLVFVYACLRLCLSSSILCCAGASLVLCAICFASLMCYIIICLYYIICPTAIRYTANASANIICPATSFAPTAIELFAPTATSFALRKNVYIKKKLVS